MATFKDPNLIFTSAPSMRVRTVTTTYTVDPAGDAAIIGDATALAFTITLPSASDPRVWNAATSSSKVFYFTCISANDVTVAPAVGQSINGATNVVLGTQYQRIALASNGTTWFNV